MGGKTKLNAAQKQAVEHFNGPAIVVAGAGTGKTAVISLRVANLIQNKKISSENILALTFTEKAAAEMQDRVDEILPYGYNDAEISTFHALGDKILRESGFAVGLPSDFVVMSNFQQAIVMQEVVNGLKLKYFKTLGNPFSFVDACLRFISRLKDENITSIKFGNFVKKQWLDKSLERDELLQLKELGEIYSEYQRLSREKSLIDYGDQIILTIELLEKNNSILRRYQEKYRYVLVDEFQDTNFAQNYLVKLLSKKLRNVMVVGDDDQSIYRFRGAAISNILNFTKDFPEAKQVVLNTNYRSKQKILDSAYGLIQGNNPYRLEIENGLSKKLKGLDGYSEVNVEASTTIVEEMNYIASQIQSLRTTKGLEYNDIAILLRKNSQAKEVAHALEKLSIPYVVAESQNLFEQAEIKVLLHFVRALNDPSASDALYGLLVSDLYKVPFEQIAKYSAQATKGHESLETYLANQDNLPDAISSALSLVQAYRGEVLSLSAGQILYKFIESTGYLKRLIADAVTDHLAVQKIQNISQFFVVIKEFELSSPHDPHIFAFWRHINSIRESSADILIQPSPLDTNSVSIMTIHKAKGLEFEAVFLIDLTEQTFPARNMGDKIAVPKGLLPENDDSIPWHIHEERRLFYVGMTRAKTYLYLTTSFDHGGKRLKKPSRFIQESTGQVITVPAQDNRAQIETIKSFAQLPQRQNFNPLSKFTDERGWLNLSTNQLASYMRSPIEFWYFDVLSLPKGPFHALVYGSAIHAAIELYYRARLSGEAVKLKQLLASFENSWKSEGFVSLDHEKERYESGRKVLARFFKKEQGLKDIPKQVEKPFTLRLESLKLNLSGRYDAVYDRGGKIEIRDFKTGEVGSLANAQKKLKDSLQMQIYALAWEKQHQSPVNSVSLYFVEQDILADTNKIDNHKTYDTLSKLVAGIRDHKFSEKGSSRIKFEGLL